MLPELNNLYQSMEKRKAEMLAYMESLTDGQRNQKPTRTDWSPLQVMEHLVMVEEWMAAPNKAAPPDNGIVLMKGRIFIALGGALMRSALRIPTVPQAQPQENLDYNSVKARWDKARNALLHKITAVAPETCRLPIALHPVAGPLNALQILQLLDTHLVYHLRHLPRGTALEKHKPVTVR